MASEPTEASPDRTNGAPSRTEVVRFGVFEVDRRSGELRRQGRRVALGDKPFQLLSALLERSGEVVLRSELRDRLWEPDVHVDFDRNLNTAATNLRAALGDSATSPRFIETLPKRGYRFIAPVAGGPSPTTAPARVPLWRRSALAGIAVAIVFALGSLYLSRSGSRVDADRRMVAVMPIADLGPEPGTDYLTDGLTEELIAELGRLRPERLGVIARMSAMSYKDTNKRIDQIADELGVDYVVEGSLRRFEGRFRVVVQLIHAADQTRLWSTTFEEASEDVLGVQIDLAARAAEALVTTLLPEESVASARPSTLDPAAFDAYLRGRSEWNRFEGDGYRKAVEHLTRAVEIDPRYALAWAGLADAHNLLAFEERPPPRRFKLARKAAQRALEIDADLPEAHNSLAFGMLYSDLDIDAADAAFARALELDPNLAMAHHWRAGALSAQQRHDEAVATMQRAVELDPRSLSVRSDLGWYLLFADRYEEALAECRRTLSMQDGYGWAAICVFESLYRLGRPDEAVQAEVLRLRQRGDAESAWLDSIDSLESDAALEAIFQYHLDRELDDPEQADPIAVALLEARLGDPMAAVDWLERAVEMGNGWVVFLRVDPRLDGLHGLPRFEALAAELELPAP